MIAHLDLPMPPPLNNLFPTRGGRRVPSERYRAWRDDARIELLAQRPPHIAGPFSAELSFQRPDRRRRDLDGCGVKAVLDSLVSAGVIEDDHLAKRIILEWAGDEPVKSARVIITLRSAV